MDVFSEIIVTAVDKVKNAVVKVDKYSKVMNNERLSGSGSGFVFSSDGLILTNSHVIDNSDRLVVTLLDGNEFAAEVKGIDKDTDIAIIKIYGSGYSPAKLGESGYLRIGQLVIAIGNPLGYQHSVSVGVLSGVGRTMRTPASRINLREGDIIIEFNGSSISSSGELTKHLIGGDLISKTTKIKVLRQTRILELQILPVERPAA